MTATETDSQDHFQYETRKQFSVKDITRTLIALDEYLASGDWKRKE